MVLKGLRDEDFTQYKKPSMFLIFPHCSFKCCKEQHLPIETCQNCELAQAPAINIHVQDLIDRYEANPITKAVVMGGMEPFDSWDDVQCFIMNFRYKNQDPIIIYTGYREDELREKLRILSLYTEDGPIIVKFGRYLPGHKPHYSDELGVYLASPNQYARRITYNEDYIKPR